MLKPNESLMSPQRLQDVSRSNCVQIADYSWLLTRHLEPCIHLSKVVSENTAVHAVHWMCMVFGTEGLSTEFCPHSWPPPMKEETLHHCRWRLPNQRLILKPTGQMSLTDWTITRATVRGREGNAKEMRTNHEKRSELALWLWLILNSHSGASVFYGAPVCRLSTLPAPHLYSVLLPHCLDFACSCSSLGCA